jgi:30S ribosomal protein S31
MGKGDIKTRKGKISAGSYGKRRPRGFEKKAVVAEVKIADKATSE